MANGHGGPRKGSGPKPGSSWSPEAIERNRAKRAASEQATRADVAANVSKAMVRMAQASAARREQERPNPFKVPRFPPEAIPKDKKFQLAMDNYALSWGQAELAASTMGIASAEGLEFLGYAYLANLAQRPEYRTFAETIADDATRKWIDFEVVGQKRREEKEELDDEHRSFDEPDPEEREEKLKASGKADRVKAIKDEIKRLAIREAFYALSRDDCFFGRAHLFLNFSDEKDPVDGGQDAEIKTDLGDSTNDVSRSKVGKQRPLRSVKVIEAVWCYPMIYNALDPLRADWYMPRQWYVMGRELHISRLLLFVGHPVPDILKPAYAFGGVSLSQLAKPYVDIWLRTRTSVGDLLHAFSVMVLKTDMAQILAPGGTQLFADRAWSFTQMRDNQGLFVVNKETEDFANVSASLSGLHELQAQAQEHMMCCRRGTLVETERGQIPIEQITTVDKVMTRNGLAPVRWSGQTGLASELIEICAGGSVLEVTGWHPIWSETTRKFVNAENVDPSHRLLRSISPEPVAVPLTESVEIASVRAIKGSPKPVYNLEVADGFLPEFFADGILVHNSVARIPATKFTGIQPSGLSTTSEGEMRAYYDTIAAYQNRFFRPNLTKVINFVQLSLFGDIDPGITFEFEPLWETSEKERAELQKMDTERDTGLIDAGVLSPAEKRRQIIDDPHMPYGDLDPDDLPDLREEEEEGLIPEGAGRATEGLLETGPSAGEGEAPREEDAAPAGHDDAVPAPEARGVPWGDLYEWMRGYDLPAKRRDGVPVSRTASGEAARRGLRIGSRVRYGIEGGPGTGRIFGFARNAGAADDVAVLDHDRDRAVFVPLAAVQARPVALDGAPTLSKEDADYRDRWNEPGTRCVHCTMFVMGDGAEANRCTLVKGSISILGHCKHFDRDDGGNREGPGHDLDPLFAGDADFREDQHRRDETGKFTGGGGSGSGGGSSSSEKEDYGSIPDFLKRTGEGSGRFAAPQFGLPNGPAKQPSYGPEQGAEQLSAKAAKKPLDPAKLKRVGQQMGSNPGGTFEDEEGRRYYVKKPQTKDHARNELLAASLYRLAGTPTLSYVPVEGGAHVATRIEKLDKDNAKKLSPAEIAEAGKDFAVHAWLGNYDAVGTGGDNLGTIGGAPVPLDLGGALEYRARGAPKGAQFGEKVGELQSMRDPKVAPDAAKIFGQMTPAQLRESARFVTGIPDGRIRAAVKASGSPDALADKLIARKKDIAAQAATFGAEGDPKKPTSTMVIPADGDLPVKELNGIKFDRWRPPSDWATVDGQADIDEPEFKPSPGKQAASGVVIREPDGRVWMVRPRNGYGGYEASFPKGRVDAGLSPQANAIKEAYEESGLKVRIVGLVGDHDGDLTTTRYYEAVRESGDPSKHEDETDGVVLAPKNKLDGFLNRKRDQQIAATLAGDAHEQLGLEPAQRESAVALDDGGFQETDHPRKADGKFAPKGGGESGSSEEGGGAESSSEVSAEQKIKEGLANETGSTLELTEEEKTALINKYGSVGAAIEKIGNQEGPASAAQKEEEKPTFGGLWKKLTGPYAGGETEEFHHNVQAVLEKGPSAGSNWRRMTMFLIKDADKHGVNAEQKAALKSKLVAGIIKAQNNAAAAGNKASVDKLQKLIDKIGIADPETLSAATKVVAPTPASIPKTEAPKPAPPKPGAAPPAFLDALKKIQTDYPVSSKPSMLSKVKAAAMHGASVEQLDAALKPAEKKKLDKYFSYSAKKNDTTPVEYAHKKYAGLYGPGGPYSSVPPPPKPAAPTPEQQFAEAQKFAEANKSSIPPPTEAELTKAKKNVALQLQYVPGGSNLATSFGQGEANKLVAEFNAKYANKQLNDPGALAQKVNDFKMLGAKVAALQKIEDQNKSDIQKQQAAKQAEANAKAAQALQEQQQAAKAKTKEYMDALGISETEATGFDALVGMMGGSKSDVISQFKSYESQAAKLGYPITGFQYALIRNYIDGGYQSINKALRNGSWSASQHVYARLVNNALDKLPKYAGDVVRGAHLDADQIAKYKPGHVVVEQAFTSTGIGYKFGGNVSYKIKAIGKRGADFSKGANQGEKEVLFKAHTCFLVHSVKQVGNTTHVEMEEVEGHG